ncbi:Uncharacterized protein PKNOH_S100057900 [Plasmodium knowlesi]|uniref:Uncharacterized protein n=1 Tax=Plasmodium knowlesi TaxID=5850 RepID=A0A1Y3DLG1_PLAKN|nr:Uncharacterized protein PKNOH_S100057900 [Plasmodium knowlesi]
MGGNICVFQRKKYDEEKRELALRNVSKGVMRKDAIVNEIIYEGVIKHSGEGTDQIGKTNEQKEKSILSIPSTSTNSDSDESEEATTDTSFLTSSTMIRSNIKASIICESQENFLELFESIRKKEEDKHQENYLRGEKNYPTMKSHSQRIEPFSSWGSDDPLDVKVPTRKEHKTTPKGELPLRRMKGERILAYPRRSEDNSTSVNPRKWGKRGKSLDFSSWNHNADYKRGRALLTKCNSSYFNNRDLIIYS